MSLIQTLFKARKEKLARLGRKPKKQLRFFQPRTKTLENQYAKTIDHLTNKLKPLVRKMLTTYATRVQHQDSVRLDDELDDLSEALSTLRNETNAIYTDANLEADSRKAADVVREKNKKVFSRFFVLNTGKEFFLDETIPNKMVKGFVKQNASLIKTIPERFLRDTQNIIFQNYRDGVSPKATTEQIMKKFKVMKSNAKRIARDQISKLNGQIAEERQKNQAGLEEYIWRTVRDSRVRKEHKAREGKTYRWDSPPKGGHPGTEINCRCYAEPKLDL